MQVAKLQQTAEKNKNKTVLWGLFASIVGVLHCLKFDL